METSSDRERRLRESALAFFGRITASVSHDVNNVLSTMGELSGLLQDFILAGQESAGMAPAKLQRVADGLTAQVQKGAAIVKRLNRFAHSADDSAKTVDLVEQLDSIAALAQRFATLKQVSLETNFGDESIFLRTNPFLLQQAVFLCIDTALLSADQGCPVIVSACKREGGAEIVVTSRLLGTSDEIDARLSLLSLLMQELGGTVENVPGQDGTHRLVLIIPRDKPA